jgi:hypothetical protein
LISRAGNNEDAKEFDFPFLWHFVNIMEKVNQQCE